jgi:hypothetical protein
MELKEIGIASQEGHDEKILGAHYMLGFHKSRLVSIWKKNKEKIVPNSGTDYIIHDERHPRGRVTWWALFD